MEYEEHPYPEHPLWRLGPAVLALLLAAAAGAVMFTLPPGDRRTAVEVVLLSAQIVLVAGHGWYRRRCARRIDPGVAVQHFAVFWSAYTLGADLLASNSHDSPLDTVLEGLIFAVPMTLGSWWSERTRDHRTTTETRQPRSTSTSDPPTAPPADESTNPPPDRTRERVSTEDLGSAAD